MVPPGFGGSLDDPVFGQAEVIAPAADMGPGWPVLPPGGQGTVGIKAQRFQQFCEKMIETDLARWRILLLLYWFV